MAMVETTPAVHAAVVVDRREPAPGIVVLGLDAPMLAASARPGQFVMVVPPGGERASVALAVYEAEGSRISLMVVIVGMRTALVASQPVGAPLDLIGPLGNGFDLEGLGADVGIVAGGVGFASLLLAAQALAGSGRRARLYYGARSADALVDVDRFTGIGIGASLATDDGTRGHRGFVTELVERERRDHTALIACGPTPMLRSVARLANAQGLPAQVSLEEAFGCGVGACWGCVVPHAASDEGALPGLVGVNASLPNVAVARDAHGRPFAYVRVCREGPVFWANELRW